jgi:hypothetical protein
MRQSNREFGEIAGLAIGRDCAAVLLGHDVVANREAETSALAGRLGREERLEQLIFDLGWNTNSAVPHLHLDRITESPRRYLWRPGSYPPKRDLPSHKTLKGTILDSHQPESGEYPSR